MKGFLGGVKAELKKVSWPDKKELASYTGVVLIAVVFVCALIWICDTVFAKMLEIILR
ncbi:preprotein translocase subunit SecE [Propionispira arboris]|uniref:preprotein translocase subunit SecE n=1 Tax=Propionispira arboris TaxID=84035 RepID=UPI003183E5FB